MIFKLVSKITRNITKKWMIKAKKENKIQNPYSIFLGTSHGSGLFTTLQWTSRDYILWRNLKKASTIAIES